MPAEDELTVCSSMLDGKFTVKVIRTEPFRGELTTANGGTMLLCKPGSLAYNAQFGPDVDDVASWQDAAIPNK